MALKVLLRRGIVYIIMHRYFPHILVNDKGVCLWEMSRQCDFYETRHIYRTLHADQKSPWPQSRRIHPLTYRGHRRSHYRDMARTLLWKLPQCDFDENRHTDTC